VYWENLEIFWVNQLQRKMITTVVVNIMLIGSFAAIAFSKGAQVGLTKSGVANCDTCPQMQKDVTWINYWKQRSDFVVCLRCYCAEGRINENEFGKTDNFCDDNKITELQITLLGVIAVAGVIIINNILKRALVFFTIFERNHTITDEEQGLAMKMFLAQFMNTSIIILIINADFSSVAYIQEHASLKTAFIGEYSDFTERWYRDVGLAMTSTLLTNSIAPHATVLAKWPTELVKQRLLAGGCVTQKALNTLFTGPEYLLSERYGAMFNMIFSIFLYSPGLPFMWLFACVYMAAGFWSDKIILLRVNKRPTAYDEKLATMTNSLMLYAVMMHLTVGIWMYGYLPGRTMNLELVSRLGFSEYFRRRLLKLQSFPILLLLCAFILGQILAKTVPLLSHSCIATGLAHTALPRVLGSPLQHLRRDWAHPSNTCAGTRGPTRSGHSLRVSSRSSRGKAGRTRRFWRLKSDSHKSDHHFASEPVYRTKSVGQSP
jgi:hypothetical protein